jgi:hypothetical protein
MEACLTTPTLRSRDGPADQLAISDKEVIARLEVGTTTIDIRDRVLLTDKF